MQFYWSAKSLPELAHLPRDERKRFWKRYRYKPFKTWRGWVVMLGYAAALGGLVGSIATAYAMIFDLRADRVLLLAVPFVSVVGYVMGIGLHLHLTRPYLRRDLPVCPACGYDLRGIEGRCPECGTGRDLPSED